MGRRMSILADRVDALHVSNTTAAKTSSCEDSQAILTDNDSVRTSVGSLGEPSQATELSDDLTDITWGEGCFHEKGAVTGSNTMLYAVHFENSSVNDLVLNNCKFINVVFRNCNLSNVKICDAFFADVVLENSDLDDLIWVSARWQDKAVTGMNISNETLGLGDPIPEQISDPNWVRDNYGFVPPVWAKTDQKIDTITEPPLWATTDHNNDTITNRVAQSDVKAAHVKTLSQFEKDRYDGKLGPFRFFDLGKNKKTGEDDPSIRNKIYSYLLASDAIEVVDASSRMLSTPNNGLAQQSLYQIEDTYWGGKAKARPSTYFARSSLGQRLSTGICASVLYANKQMHKEAAVILYGQEITFAGSAEGAMAWLRDVSMYKHLIRNITFQYRILEQTEHLENFSDFLTLPTTKKTSFLKLCGRIADMIEKNPGFHRFSLIVVEEEVWSAKVWCPANPEELRGIAFVAIIVGAFYRRDKIDQMGQLDGVSFEVLTKSPMVKRRMDFVKKLEGSFLSEGIEVADKYWEELAKELAELDK